MTRRNMMLSLVGVLMTTMLTIWGCGGSSSTGSGSYPDPSPTTTKSSVPTIIDAKILKQWIDEGKLNAPLGSQDRVVVVSPSSAADWTKKGHIPGAVRWGDNELAMPRVEGLALATNIMPTGAFMDTIIKRLGIDGNTTIVISLPKNANLYLQSLLYWDLRYWGFPKERLKILNAGDDAWEVAGYPISNDATEKYTASTYSVAQNGTLKDIIRGSLGETISIVDSLITTPALKNSWQIIDVRGATVSPYMTNALRYVAQGTTPSYAMYFTRLNAGDGVTRNFLYPDKATLLSRMATLAVKDGTADVFASPSKKTLVMCAASSSASPTFALFDAVLDVPEGDIIMYDGSSSQWYNYNTLRLTGINAYPNATAAQISAWSFNNATNPRAQGAFAGGTGSTAFDYTTNVQIWEVFSPVLGPSDPSMNQVETADKAYMTPAATPSTGGTSGGGSAPSGC